MFWESESVEIRCTRCRIRVDIDDKTYADEDWNLLCEDCYREVYGKKKLFVKDSGTQKKEIHGRTTVLD